MSDEEKLSKLHNIALDLLKRMRDAAEMTGVSFMLDSGTLLGAVRHCGFIPWDDDADILMMRGDFEKFVRDAGKYFDGDYEFIIPCQKGDEAFYDFVPKIIYKGAATDRGSADDVFYRGRYSCPALDIFVMDAAPRTGLGQAVWKNALILIYGLAMGHRRTIDYGEYSALQGLVIRALSFFGKYMPLYKIAALYRRVSVMFNKRGTGKLMKSNFAMDAFGDVFDGKWYDGTTDVLFEGETFKAPKMYDEVLKKHYGDYMNLPKESDRKPKHTRLDKIEFLRG